MHDLIEQLHGVILGASEAMGITLELATVLLLLVAVGLGTLHWGRCLTTCIVLPMPASRTGMMSSSPRWRRRCAS